MKHIFLFLIFSFSSAFGLTPENLEKLSSFQFDAQGSGTFEKMQEAFSEVVEKESLPGNPKTLAQIVSELQSADRDYAFSVVQDKSFWKLLFLLQNGWDIEVLGGLEGNLLEEALVIGHLPNVELILRMGGYKLYTEKKIPALARKYQWNFDEDLKSILLFYLQTKGRAREADKENPVFELDGISRRIREPLVSSGPRPSPTPAPTPPPSRPTPRFEPPKSTRPSTQTPSSPSSVYEAQLEMMRRRLEELMRGSERNSNQTDPLPKSARPSSPRATPRYYPPPVITTRPTTPPPSNGPRIDERPSIKTGDATQDIDGAIPSGGTPKPAPAPSPRSTPVPMAPKGPPPADDGFMRVQVPYATNRAYDLALRKKISQPSVASSFYSFTSTGTLGYGLAEVTIPKIHEISKLESKGFFEKENPKKHVLLNNLRLRTEAEFYADLAERFRMNEENFSEEKKLAEASKSLLVYIHGFNVNFDYAMRKTAQLMYDLDFPGVSVAFSWPAKAVRIPIPVDFLRDVSRAEESYEALEEFLRKILREHPDRKIHILAHSLGTRILSEVLLKIAEKPSPADAAKLARNEKLFGEVVLASPAMDAHDFETRLGPHAVALCDRVSIFASNVDIALKVQTVAEKLKSFPLGLFSGKKVAIPNGVFTFDLSELSLGALSLDHAMYSDVEAPIAQMRRLFVDRMPADYWLKEDQRRHLFLKKLQRPTFFSPGEMRHYWKFSLH